MHLDTGEVIQNSQGGRGEIYKRRKEERRRKKTMLQKYFHGGQEKVAAKVQGSQII